MDKIDLQLDIPSECARKLLEDEVDIGLVPVAVIPKLKEHQILTNYCIGADGAVKSVGLFSEVPLEEIEKVYLDYQSRTSVELVKILARDSWKISPEWLPAQSGFEKEIGGTTAAVVIGDRTFQLMGKTKHVYDLAEEWKKLTGLPFVFACWVANKNIEPAFEKQLNAAMKFGLTNLPKAINGIQEAEITKEQLLDYLQTNISYSFDEQKRKAMQKFLRLLPNS